MLCVHAECGKSLAKEQLELLPSRLRLRLVL